MLKGMPPKKDTAATWDNSLERKIHFFRADVGTTKAGEPKPFKSAPLLQHLDTLAYEDGKRYIDVGEGNVACAWVDQHNGSPLRMRLATVRRTSLPMIEEGGVLSGLGLTTRQGLYEPIHICIFPKNIVGVEFNFYGPRPSRLAGYLTSASPRLCPELELQPLLRQDVADQLARLQRLSSFDLAIRPSWISTIRQANRSLADAFDAAANAGGSQIVHLTLQAGRYQRGTWLHDRMAGVARRLASRPGLRENAEKFVVKGLNEEIDAIEEVDVLKDQLISTKRIFRVDKRTRVLDDASAYAAIEQAYSELKADLEAAASIAISRS